jgi:site-specific DNA-methyltransferase (adenine-specific)
MAAPCAYGVEWAMSYCPQSSSPKPIDLLRYLIRTYSNEGDTILDNTMGSGSTGVACIKEKRNFIGIELNDEYFDIAKQRIENEQRQLTLF